METLIHLLFSGEKLPGGSNAYSVGYEGIPWSTAGWIFAALAILVAWSYTHFARNTSRAARIGLVLLRLFLIATLLLLLVRPVLIIPIEETTRRPLLVLLDTSRSMTLADRRDTEPDRARAALAAGLIDPAGGLGQTLPASTETAVVLTRGGLLTALAENPRLDLWPRLQAAADLSFYGFGQPLADLGPLTPTDGERLSHIQSGTFFRAVAYQNERSALGDGLRDVLAKARGQTVAGVLVITDGANNDGSSPIEAARAALDDDVPLFIYGIGVSAAPDIVVTDLVSPVATSVKERVDIIVRFTAQGLVGRQSNLTLKAGDKVIAQERVDIRTDGEQEWRFSFVPEKIEELELSATITPLPQESVKTNNTRSASLRVMDQKMNILLVQRAPNWDFHYLLALLQRDRRVNVNCVLLKGDPGLAAIKDSPFLPTLPSNREALLAYDVIILGDLAPDDLGDGRMKLLHEWVNQIGGGLVFLSGSYLNANAYRGTPLEPVLPVTPSGTTPQADPNAELPLRLTPAGAASPLLRVSDDLRANVDTWNAFPGVRWITPAGPARPAAQVLLTGPHFGRPGETPPAAIAMQSYGAGQALYFGFGETHRWRAKHGEKYHARLWLQMLQAISARREPGTSALTQLKVERAEYFPGERVRITARILKRDYTPLEAAEVLSMVRLKTSGSERAQPVTVHLSAVAGRPGEFSGETPASVEGSYGVSLTSDPQASVPFRVKPSSMELRDIALRERTLRAMAAASGGKFLREEDLHQLPGWIAAETAKRVSYKKIPLSLAPMLLALMILAACAEWLWRRKAELK